jgi:hypothetical protein
MRKGYVGVEVFIPKKAYKQCKEFFKAAERAGIDKRQIGWTATFVPVAEALAESSDYVLKAIKESKKRGKNEARTVSTKGR